MRSKSGAGTELLYHTVSTVTTGYLLSNGRYIMDTRQSRQRATENDHVTITHGASVQQHGITGWTARQRNHLVMRRSTTPHRARHAAMTHRPTCRHHHHHHHTCPTCSCHRNQSSTAVLQSARPRRTIQTEQMTMSP